MTRHDDLMNNLFDRVLSAGISKENHANCAVWFIDDLSKLIQNIRQTSLNEEDAYSRLIELSKISGITYGTLLRFYK